MEPIKYRQLKIKHDLLIKVKSQEGLSFTTLEFLHGLLERTRNDMEAWGVQNGKKKEAKRHELIENIQQLQTTVEKHAIASSEKDPFQSLPDEMLENILGQIKDSEDLKNCYEAYPTFERILEPRKPLWVFKEVLPMILRQELLDKTNILICRQVCQTWKGVVDRLFENYTGPKSCTLVPYECRLFKDPLNEILRVNSIYLLDGFYKLERFASKYSSTTTNPFLGRRIVFENNDLEYWMSVKAFLKKFGTHVWACTFMVHCDTRLELLESLRFVRDSLHYLPNLRELSISTSPSELPGRVLFNDPLTREVRQNLQTTALAELPHLVRLEIEDLPSCILQRWFSKYVGDLHTLQVLDSDILRSTNVLQDFPALQNLAHLQVTSNGEWRNFSQLAFLEACPLKKLTLAQKGAYEKIELDDILETLTFLQSTLEELSLEYDDTGLGDTYVIIASTDSIRRSCNNLWLPKLQFLDLQGYYESFDFLLCCPSLKVLNVRFMDNLMLTERYSELIQVYGFVDKMYNSNIWDLVPSLQELKFYLLESLHPGDERVVKQYKRESYDRLKNKLGKII